ncbi:MAG: helix-turn-helix transcriptional regulator [Gammaproteobacteria bacterium]
MAPRIRKKSTQPQADEIIQIGLRLKASRTALGMTAKDLCMILGTQPNTFSQWETGARTPAWYVMVKYSRIYQVSMDWIYAGNPVGMDGELLRKILLQWAQQNEEE